MNYMNKKVKIILTVTISAALLIGIPLTIISHGVSPYKVIENDLVQLDYNTAYKYVAQVNKSIIYYNRDIIGMDEPLYIPLTKNLDFNMSFTVSSSLTDIVDNKGIINLRIRLTEPDGWSILLNNTTYIINTTNTTIHFSVNVSEIRDIIGGIRKEIGLSSLEYDIEIDPVIKVSTKLPGNIINRIIEPKLVLTLDFQRNKIIYNNLDFTDTYKKTDRQVIPATLGILGIPSISVQNLRYISYTLIAVGVATSLLFIITRERTLSNVVESFLHKYDNIIIKAATITSSSRKVLVKDFRELLRISRLLGKPIVYYKEGGSHVFTVIDSETLYILSLDDEGKPIAS